MNCFLRWLHFSKQRIWGNTAIVSVKQSSQLQVSGAFWPDPSLTNLAKSTKTVPKKASKLGFKRKRLIPVLPCCPPLMEFRLAFGVASSTGNSTTASPIAACAGGAGASTSAAVAGITGTAAAASSSSVATILGVGAAAVGFGLRVLSTISTAKLDVDVEIIRTTVADCHANTPLRAIPKESLVEFFVRTEIKSMPFKRFLSRVGATKSGKASAIPSAQAPCAAPLCHRSAVKEPQWPPALLSSLQLDSSGNAPPSMPTLLGHGHFGKVYRGQLLNGCTVASKVTSLGPQPSAVGYLKFGAAWYSAVRCLCGSHP